MKKTIHRAATRGYADHGWLRTHHTFSFAGYYDPGRIHFGALRVLNDDTVAPGNAVYSLVAAVAVTLICGFSYGYWVGAVFAGVFTGILCFALLQLCAALTRKRREHLDDPKDGE